MDKNNIFSDFKDNIFPKVKENKIVKFLINKNMLMVVLIGIFLFTSITVIKTFILRKKVNTYEEEIFEITEKLENEVKLYYDKNDNIEINVEKYKKVAADELVKCINEPVDYNNLPSSINDIINEINNYYNSSYNYFAFKYKDIYTGFTVSYNENQNIFTASTIKAPTDLYIYEMAALGKIDLDEELTYTSRYYNEGSGILKNQKFNTKHTVRELTRLSTMASDNAAHNMLEDHFGRNNMLDFWSKLGTKAIFTANNNWGVTNAHDATIYMQELYNFYVNNSEYGEEIMKNFLDAYPKFISYNGNKNNVANKSGWSGSAIHDVAIVFADNPYIVVALSNLGETEEYPGYFWNASKFAERLHTEYWKYKMDNCGNISQY